MDKEFANQNYHFNQVLYSEKLKVKVEEEKEQIKRKMLNSKSSSPVKLFDTLDNMSLSNANEFEFEDDQENSEDYDNRQSYDFKGDHYLQNNQNQPYKEKNRKKSNNSAQEQKENAAQAQKIIYDVLDNDPQMEIEIMRAGMRKKVFDKLDML